LKRLAAPRLVFNLGMVLLLFAPLGGSTFDVTQAAAKGSLWLGNAFSSARNFAGSVFWGQTPNFAS
jgi:hypothetical protein